MLRSHSGPGPNSPRRLGEPWKSLHGESDSAFSRHKQVAKWRHLSVVRRGCRFAGLLPSQHPTGSLASFFFLFFFLCCSQLTSAIPAGRTAGEFFIGPRPQPRRDLQRRHGSICGAVPLFGFRVISRKTKMEGDKKQTSIFQRKLEDTSRLFLQARIHTFTSEPK